MNLKIARTSNNGMKYLLIKEQKPDPNGVKSFKKEARAGEYITN